MKDHAETNQLLLQVIVLPTILLSVALIGGLRVDAETRHFIFIPPPLVTLILAVLLLALFVRAGAIELPAWFAIDQPMGTNISHLLTLIVFFFASAQAFNSVLPESGLLHWMFSFFFLWTLWTNQFSAFDARRLLKSLIALFGTAFVLKHLLVAALSASEGGWLRKLTATLLQGIAIDVPHFAPATGYISFFALVLYVTGLWLTSPRPRQTDLPMIKDHSASSEDVERLRLSIDAESK